MSDLSCPMEEHLPLELLSDRSELTNIGLVCVRWREALSYDLIWEKNYARFYGEVNPRMAAIIKDWSFTYRRRNQIDKEIRKILGPLKLFTMNEKILKIRLVGGNDRFILCVVPSGIKLFSLTSGLTYPAVSEDISTTFCQPSEDGKRILLGSGTGAVTILGWDYLNKKYEVVHKFNDGHNHKLNMNRAIEQVSENEKFVVSLAYNNTVAVWEKIPLPKLKGVALDNMTQLNNGLLLDPYAYSQQERKVLRKEVERVHEETFLFNFHANPQNHVVNNDKDIMKKGPISDKEKNLQKKNQLKSTYMEDPFSKKAQKGESTLGTNYNNNNNNNRTVSTRRTEIIDIPPSPQPDWGQKGPYLKSMLFKYPPSKVYMVPGKDLIVVICTHSGKILIWQTYNNLLLKGHTTAVTQCLGFYRGESTYLISLSKEDEDDSSKTTIFLWDLSNTSTTVTEKKPIATAVIDGECRYLAYDLISETIVVLANKLTIYYPWSVSDENVVLKPVAVVSKPIVCARIDEGKSLLYTGMEDGSVMVFYLATAQMIGHTSPTRSHQYFSLIDIRVDQGTFMAVDSNCVHWKNLGFEKPVNENKKKHIGNKSNLDHF